MAKETKITIEDTMRATFAAILNNDYAERDKLCAMMERTFQEHGNVPLPSNTPIKTGKENLS